MSEEKAKGVDLIAAVEQRIKKVHTSSFDLSFNEMLDMKTNGELDINPDYQRVFQWSEGARSRFIESLLLEMPVPPIYVVEEDEGKYTLIDGLQRISSYLHLRGELEAAHLDPPIHKGTKLKLVDCDIVEELNDKTWDDLPLALQIRLKRAFVRVEVVRKGSDVRFKYHMFKRLNTGGQLLSDQQLRNCTIRLLDDKFNDFIIELSKDHNFKVCTDNITDEQRYRSFDQELVLRFFAFRNYGSHFKHDVSDFLTEYMEGVSEPDVERQISFAYEAEKAVFKKTFELLAKTLKELAFAYANKKGDALVKGFSVYHYEALTVGLQKHISKIDLKDKAQLGRIQTGLEALKKEEDFRKLTSGGGKNSSGQFKKRVEYVSKAVAKML